MATWQFDFHLLPARAVRERFGTVPVTITPDQFEGENWWAAPTLVTTFNGSSRGFYPGLAVRAKERVWIGYRCAVAVA